MLQEWQLWQTGCISFRAIYVVLILISYEGYYIQGKLTIKSASPLSLSKHGFFSSFVDACIYILESVSVWLVYHGLHISLDSLSLCQELAYKDTF